MKPKDLKPPFTRHNRHLSLQHQMFYMPAGLAAEEYLRFASHDWLCFFQTLACPVSIEVCSGNGDWVLHKAQSEPSVQWIAIEQQFDRCRKIWSKRENGGVKNLLIVCGPAQLFFQYFFNKSKAQAIYINFPDPWPKQRHHKHRLISPDFLQLLEPALLPSGLVTLSTDDHATCERMIKGALQKPGLTPLYPSPYFKEDVEDYGFSYFEKLWKEQNRTIHYTSFVRL